MTSKLVAIIFIGAFLLGPAVCAQLDAGTLGLTDLPGEIEQSVVTNLDLSALPLLEQNPDTCSYELWLRSRLDRQVVADEWTFPIQSPNLDLQPTPARLPSQQHGKMEDLPPGAQVYVARLKPIFIAEGVPAELVWLAEVESRFDTTARSSIGAVGLFQLMPETAKSLGLTLAPWDQRLQPEKNARAAARYLKYLYETFRDWRLVIAAYNGGEGLVGRLLARHAAHGYDEIAGGLPEETQMYVPAVETTIQQREGVTLESLRLPSAER